MISRTILRALWVVVAFALSAGVAMIALLGLGAYWVSNELRAAAPHDPNLPWAAPLYGIALFTTTVAPALTVLPGVVAVLAGELLHLRSVLYYTLAGGVALIAIPILASPANLPAPTGHYMTIFAGAGFIGGFIYWALAGARA